MSKQIVPFLDLQAAYQEIQQEIEEVVARVIRSGWYLLGTELQHFEEEYAHYVGAEYCIGVGNGLDALILSLLALGVQKGDEVIVPSHTYIATWLAVSHVGAIPVPVEPCENTYNLDPLKIEEAITSKTKVILPVHLYGQPADIDAINQVAERHGLAVLDDAAQAQGAKYKGQRVGHLCHLTAWSFYPGKNLGAFGDAGAVTTNDEQLAHKIRVLRNYGSKIKYENEVRGYNSRLDEVQAAVLRVKLKYLDGWNARRQQLANHYQIVLRETPLRLPFVPDWAEPVWHLYVVRYLERKSFQERLKAQGIETLIHYPIPPHRQRAYQDLPLHLLHLPLAETLSQEIVSLPMGPHLQKQQQADVVDRIKEFFQSPFVEKR
jgi:dTDP-4-amino-4,6-dideoxygalactose transaminase